MISVHFYRWGDKDSIWTVASAFYKDSRYKSYTKFVEDIRFANPAIVDWQAVAEFTNIMIPMAH